ncbi:PLDc N-terminal domain-containing protein [Roseivirga misakiensis]
MLLYIIPFLIVLAALIDIVKNEFEPSQNKLIWVIVVILIPVLGSILYFFIGRSQKVGS